MEKGARSPFRNPHTHKYLSLYSIFSWKICPRGRSSNEFNPYVKQPARTTRSGQWHHQKLSSLLFANPNKNCLIAIIWMITQRLSLSLTVTTILINTKKLIFLKLTFISNVGLKRQQTWSRPHWRSSSSFRKLYGHLSLSTGGKQVASSVSATLPNDLLHFPVTW